MRTEQIRIVIAKDQGWEGPFDFDTTYCLVFAKHPKWGRKRKVPNYPEDLNAIHEAVATLTDEEWKNYHRILDLMIPKPREFYESTALQRCQAYLKAKDLWVETNNKDYYTSKL